MNKGFCRAVIIALLVSTLFWGAACATGPGPTGSSYTAPEERDPEFWTIWADMHGGA